MATRPVAGGAAAGWLTAESALTAAASRVLALVDQHPDIHTREPVAGLVQTWHEGVPRLGFARQWFNEAARIHDEALAQFPTRLLVPLFGFGPAGRI
jgi:LemA protein